MELVTSSPCLRLLNWTKQRGETSQPCKNIDKATPHTQSVLIFMKTGVIFLGSLDTKTFLVIIIKYFILKHTVLEERVRSLTFQPTSWFIPFMPRFPQDIFKLRVLQYQLALGKKKILCRELTSIILWGYSYLGNVDEPSSCPWEREGVSKWKGREDSCGR